jgi:hypothetical protein
VAATAVVGGEAVLATFGTSADFEEIEMVSSIIAVELANANKQTLL